VLTLGDVVESKLNDMAGKPLDLIDRNQGCFQVGKGQQVYRFICGNFHDENCLYRSVCIFNDTESYQHVFNDAQVRINVCVFSSHITSPTYLLLLHAYSHFPIFRTYIYINITSLKKK
jgi:hypothetical protein